MGIQAVRKPWGFEYPLFESDSVGLWTLFLEAGQATSLHCHPRKKTGLVVLAGEVEVFFLNESLKLKDGGRVMIRPGLFHGSKAISSNGAVMLEIENPRDKNDLVRFEDNYGRHDLPYEGKEHCFELGNDLGLPLEIERLTTDTWTRGDIELRFVKGVNHLHEMNWSSNNTVLVIDGSVGLHGSEILGPGDVVSVSTIQRITQRFPITKPLDVLVVSKNVS